MRLDADFDLENVFFSNSSIEHKVAKLSRRSQGEIHDQNPRLVKSDFGGTCSIRNGGIHFSRLTFEVPGTLVILSGNYNLETGRLDFRGTARMNAKLSQMTSGVKSVLLKLVQPLFKGKNAGTVLPIKVTGSRKHPSVKLDVGHILARK
jgi:hypothetical protein